MSEVKVKEEFVCDGSLFHQRIAVPGGWIYTSIDKGHSIMGSCFVPLPQGDLQREINEILLAELFKIEDTFAGVNSPYDHAENWVRWAKAKAFAARLKAEEMRK